MPIGYTSIGVRIADDIPARLARLARLYSEREMQGVRVTLADTIRLAIERETKRLEQIEVRK